MRIINNWSAKQYSWFKAGGVIEQLFKPSNCEELQEAVREIIANNNEIVILGNCSNLIIRDGGLQQAIKLDKFREIRIIDHEDDLWQADFEVSNTLGLQKSPLGEKLLDRKLLAEKLLGRKTLYVQAGVLLSQLSFYAATNQLAGFGFCSTIPGCLGGAIKMNAGCYGSEIQDQLLAIEIFDVTKRTIQILTDFNFTYRCSNLPANYIILSAYFLVETTATSAELFAEIAQLKQRRCDTQPQHVATGGSTFKNPPAMSAWQLIKSAKADLLHINKYQADNCKQQGAFMSDKHANFMISNNATADELEGLMQQVQRTVFEHCGIWLEPEIKIIGKPPTSHAQLGHLSIP